MGGHAKQDWNLAFWGGKHGWNSLNFFMRESWPPGPPFLPGFTPQALRRHEQACKTPVSGLRCCYVLWSSKKRVTGWHFDSSSTTVGKSRGSPDHHHQYREMAVWHLEDQMAVISSGERRQSDLRSFGDLVGGNLMRKRTFLFASPLAEAMSASALLWKDL